MSTVSTASGEAALLLSVAPSANLSMLLARQAPVIGSDGAIGRNATAFSDVGAQRDAVWTMLHGMQTGSATDLASSIAAMRYGFQHEKADGSFASALASSADSTSSAAFFLQAFGRIYLGFQSGGEWAGYGTQLQSMLPQLPRRWAGYRARCRPCLRTMHRPRIGCYSTPSRSS